MTVKCAACGKFIGYSQLEEGGGAHFHFVPDNEFGPEVSVWVCKDCSVTAQVENRDANLS